MSILRVGFYGEESNDFKYHDDIVLEDNERILGFKSGKKKEHEYAFHYNF